MAGEDSFELVLGTRSPGTRQDCYRVNRSQIKSETRNEGDAALRSASRLAVSVDETRSN